VNPEKKYFDSRIVPERKIDWKPYPIAIGTPFYNAIPFLDKYLTSLVEFDYPKNLISLFFTVQGDDGTYEALQDFKRIYSKHYRKIKIVKKKMIRGGLCPHMRNIVWLRNLIVEWSKPYDLVFIDHDVFPPKHGLKRLIEGHLLGGDIVAGVYPFYQKKRLGFTAYFKINEMYYHTGLGRYGDKIFFPTYILGKRFYSDAIGTGFCYISRRVLNVLKFHVPRNLKRTEDVEFCMDARERGFKIISDFDLVVPHWGFKLSFIPYDEEKVQILAYFSKEMVLRREEMRIKNIYRMIGDEPDEEDYTLYELRRRNKRNP